MFTPIDNGFKRACGTRGLTVDQTLQGLHVDRSRLRFGSLVAWVPDLKPSGRSGSENSDSLDAAWFAEFRLGWLADGWMGQIAIAS